MGLTFLILSLLTQAAVVAQAVRLTLLRRRAGWVFVTIGVVLMLGRRAVSFQAAMDGQRGVDPVAEFIALIISVFLVTGFTLLLLWYGREIRRGEDFGAIANGTLEHLKRSAILLGLLSLLGCSVLIYLSYTSGRDAIAERVQKGGLDLARLLGVSVAGAGDPAAKLRELERLWRQTPSEYTNNYLCVIDAEGRLVLNTRRPDKVGADVGATPIPAGSGAPGTVRELVRARRDWVGRNRNAEGHEQIAAYAYSTHLNALVAVHWPQASVDAEIRVAAMPWVLGFVAVLIVVLPLSFGLLYSVSIKSQKAAFEALRRQRDIERRFRLLVENVRDYAIFMLDAGGHIASWNLGAERLHGWPAAEALGRHFSQLLAEPAADPDAPLRAAAEHDRFHAEAWQARKDGSRFLANIILTAIRDEAGAVQGYAQVTRDVTERRRSEAEIRRMNGELEERVRVRTAELEAANRELKAFSYSVSHDLRAPLRHIDGFSKLLLTENTEALSERGRRHLQNIVNAAQGMGELIDALLEMSRVSQGELTRQRVNLSALGADVVAELRRNDPARVAQVEIAPDLEATGDRRLLRIVLTNLLANAWKYTRRQAAPRIELGRRTPRDGGTIFFVSDNGAGFDMAYADRLFGAFQRLHNASDFEGIGIGLATVQRIIHRHGGRIWAESEPDRGATFFFTLPDSPLGVASAAGPGSSHAA